MHMRTLQQILIPSHTQTEVCLARIYLRPCTLLILGQVHRRWALDAVSKYRRGFVCIDKRSCGGRVYTFPSIYPFQNVKIPDSHGILEILSFRWQNPLTAAKARTQRYRFR